jgi:hypothetical protein
MRKDDSHLRKYLDSHFETAIHVFHLESGGPWKEDTSKGASPHGDHPILCFQRVFSA